MRRVPLLLLLALGCAAPVPPPTDTGAKDAAKRFYSAIISKDWAAAQDLVSADAKRKLTREQFARLAADHRKALGFEPDAVTVHAIDEHGSEAVAHVTISGKGHARHRFKDALTLLKGANGWQVVLPSSFGHPGKP